jgi:hypothetical protein
MTRARLVKTSFTAGELDPRLSGRLDLKAQEDGASRLLNVIVHPTGGVSRRPGTAYEATVPGGLRMVAFDGPDGGEILVFGAFRVDVVKAGAVVASVTASVPWDATHVPGLAWVRLDNRLLLCHPGVPPQQLVRASDGSWSIKPWRFDEKELVSGSAPSLEPFVRFVDPDVRLQAVKQGTPAANPIPAGSTVTIYAFNGADPAPIFTSLHLGVRLMLRGRQVVITNRTSDSQVVGFVLEDLVNGQTTRDWQEQAFSPVHGYPASVGFHQNRLVIGGSRDLPDRIWMSKTGKPFNFDLGTGLDDEAIAFRLAAERLHTIASVFTGRQLQVFTSAGEWVVKGFPLTPSNIQVELQTGIGSYAGRRIPPLDVDGATLFVGATGRDLREFLFADTEQAYQAADLALLSRHLMVDPVDIAFDQGRRLLLVVRADGKLAAVTLDRNSNVVAWTLLATDGQFLAALSTGGQTFLLAKRGAAVFLERLDETLTLDAATSQADATPRTAWTGFTHLNGRTVSVLADGSRVYSRPVSGGQLTVPQAASRVVAGLGYQHRIEALPLMATTARGLTPDLPYRPVRITFRLLETSSLTVDTGTGARALPLPTALPFTGDVATRAFGWRRGNASPPWRVAQSTPLPCTILCVTTEIKVND